MAKIKIRNKETEIEGKIEQGKVTPFGNSAHIIARKQHIGKKVSIIVPDEPRYTWVLSDIEKKAFIKKAKELIDRHVSDKMRVYYLQYLDNIKDDDFEIGDLYKILNIFKEHEKDNRFYKKLLGLYSELKD